MTPPILGVVKTIFNPKKWFKERPELHSESTAVEERETPVPGVYRHILGRGWFLAAKIIYTGEEKTFEPVSPPVHVTYSKVLHQYLFDDDYARRKAHGYFLEGPTKDVAVGFFRVDDVAWVNCWDEEGNFLPGPYKRYVPDKVSKRFRPMTRLDDAEYQRQKRRPMGKEQEGEERDGVQRLSRQSYQRSAAPSDAETLDIPRQLTNISTSTTSTVYPKLWDTDGDSRGSETGATTPISRWQSPSNEARAQAPLHKTRSSTSASQQTPIL